METEMTVNPGEILAARCTYDSTGHATPTKIGHTGGDEMCNLYLMFYTLSPEDDFVVCVDEQNAGLSSQLPPGNDVPLPANPELGEATTAANCNRQKNRIFAEHRAHGTETAQDYDNGRHGAPPGLPVKKQDGSSVRKRPGADTGDYPDTNTGIGDGDGDGDGETDGALPPQPRAARYNAGFVASGTQFQV